MLQQETNALRMISYPLREYISSKKDDDYQRSFASLDYSKLNPKKFSDDKNSNYLICFSAIIFVILLYFILYSYYTYVDPTCFNDECQNFVCQAYSEGLIGGHLCPDLCTTKSLQLENCLGEHKHFQSRLFDDSQNNQVIRCYLRHPLSKLNPSGDVKIHFNYPADEATFDEFYLALEEYIRKTIKLDDPGTFVDKLLKFSDFNKDEKLSLSEARSLWSLIKIDEFVYTMLLSDKYYTPKIHGTCGHLFALDKVINPHLPLDNKQELYSYSERPNWYQRIRIAIGIIEYFMDTWNYQDTEQHLYLCKPLIKSFGYDKDYEAKIIKLNHVMSLESISARLPISCKSNKDCLYDSYCAGICNISISKCQMKEFNHDSLHELCSLISSLVVPDANTTFIQSFNVFTRQCQQLVTDESIYDRNFIDLSSLHIRRAILLQNLKNLLWANIEYQMSKITKKSTKKPVAAPNHLTK